MAKVYPERLPESVLRNVRREAERKVYNALVKLDNSYSVFYSVAWQSRFDSSGAKDGEADFVVAHPEHGILVLEVKGGEIEYDATSGRWTSTDRFGETHLLDEDPATQVRRNRYVLFDALKEIPGWDSSRWLTIGYALIFPDIVVTTASLRLDLPRAIIFDAKDLSSLEAAVLRCFSHYAAHNAPSGQLGKDRLRLVESLLARSFRLKTPLSVELAYEDERLVDLTERQMIVLDMMGVRRRSAVQGCAGSGKTMLAVEKARRLARQGFRVLLTCYNEGLAADLESRIGGEVEVMTYHALCSAKANEVGISLPRIDPHEPRQDFFDQTMPSALMEAASQKGPWYDAIIVDEGQDFRDTWWYPLLYTLQDPDRSHLFIFFDDNQNLYRRWGGLSEVVDELPFSLIDNCRNTQSIHRLVASFYHAPQAVRCPGPVGRPVEVCGYRGETHLLRQLGRELHKLVVEGKVAPEDIVVLTPRSLKRSALTGKVAGQFALTEQYPPPSGGIQVSSVHKFKGLERRVVVLAEIDRFAGPELDSIFYVGCSRARTHLLLLTDGEAPEYIKDQIRRTAADPLVGNA